jgi:DNA repair exonuclease SbcCD ATPase subunit
MIEFLKYISPLALVGFVWGIYQYFDKKKIEKTESRRGERIKHFDKLQTKLNELKYLLIEPLTEINKLIRILNTKLLSYESEVNREIEILEQINKKLKNTKEASIEKETLVKEQNQIIDSLNERRIESNKFLEDENETVRNNLKPLSNKIETKTAELNEIPILGMSNITSEILKLTLKLKEIVNIIKTNDTHSSKDRLSKEFIDSMSNATDIIDRIESEINIEMK